jgi:acyl dehydratase
MGGFGGPKSDGQLIPNFEDQKDNDVMIEHTNKNLAFLFRLVGDDNPLHIDPVQSKEIGLDVPILHGMCTYGIIIRAIYDKYLDNDQFLIRRTGIRFTSFVFPGETLEITSFKSPPNRIQFKAKTKERGKVVAIGFVDIKDRAKM